MKLCIISPTAGLEQYATQSDGVHLVLIHLVETDPVYTAFYRKRSKMGDKIILDNGAFEFGYPADTERMLRAAEQVKAHVLVAPDFPKEPFGKTVDSTFEFAMAVEGKGYTVMGCPQSEIGDVSGWVRSIEYMSSLPGLSHIGISILATPNAFGPTLGMPKGEPVDIELCRLNATFLLKSMIKHSELDLRDKKLHYLGGGHRVDLIKYYDIADSLDTSSPVWHGWNGIAYEHDFLPNGKIKLPVDFNAQLPTNAWDLTCIQGNINVLKKLARQANEHS